MCIRDRRSPARMPAVAGTRSTTRFGSLGTLTLAPAGFSGSLPAIVGGPPMGESGLCCRPAATSLTPL
eukprot:14875113-Alexandrium_andersonii.AAC.1